MFAAGSYYKGIGYKAYEEPTSLEELVQRTWYRTHSILDIGWFVPEVPELDAPLSGQLALFDIPANGEISSARNNTQLDSPAVPEAFAARYGGEIYPVSPCERIALFGTAWPTKWSVADSYADHELDNLNRRLYLILYEDTWPSVPDPQPEQIFFYGWSGGG